MHTLASNRTVSFTWAQGKNEMEKGEEQEEHPHGINVQMKQVLACICLHRTPGAPVVWCLEDFKLGRPPSPRLLKMFFTPTPSLSCWIYPASCAPCLPALLPWWPIRLDPRPSAWPWGRRTLSQIAGAGPWLSGDKREEIGDLALPAEVVSMQKKEWFP